jgi:hypothetical protein
MIPWTIADGRTSYRHPTRLPSGLGLHQHGPHVGPSHHGPRPAGRDSLASRRVPRGERLSSHRDDDRRPCGHPAGPGYLHGPRPCPGTNLRRFHRDVGTNRRDFHRDASPNHPHYHRGARTTPRRSRNDEGRSHPGPRPGRTTLHRRHYAEGTNRHGCRRDPTMTLLHSHRHSHRRAGTRSGCRPDANSRPHDCHYRARMNPLGSQPGGRTDAHHRHHVANRNLDGARIHLPGGPRGGRLHAVGNPRASRSWTGTDGLLSHRRAQTARREPKLPRNSVRSSPRPDPAGQGPAADRPTRPTDHDRNRRRSRPAAGHVSRSRRRVSNAPRRQTRRVGRRRTKPCGRRPIPSTRTSRESRPTSRCARHREPRHYRRHHVASNRCLHGCAHHPRVAVVQDDEGSLTNRPIP